MKTDAFRIYLKSSYKKDISPEYLSEIVSRCSRVEQKLGVNLDQIQDVEQLKALAESISTSPSETRSIKSALNRYSEFKRREEP